MRLWAKRASRALLLCAALLPAALANAEDPPPAISLSAFSAEVDGFSRLAASCAAEATACDARSVPGTQQVSGSAAGTFQVSWEWLGTSLKSARNASAADRLRSMQPVQAHLQELGRSATADSRVGDREFKAARAAATAALQREEFRAAEGPSWLDQRLARLQDWILRIFSGVDRLGRKAPWLAPLIEWGCFGLAAAGLLFFLQRNLRRQALRISLTEGAMLQRRTGGSAEDWETKAGEQARRGQWRDAVHSLFWAAIALLEGRRVLRANPARTPREYLRLLRPGSEAQAALVSLTRLFERSWYGVRETTEAEYKEAATALERLQSAKPDRADGPMASTAAAAVAGGL